MSAPLSSIDAGQWLASHDWAAVSAALDAQGWAILPGLLASPECDALAALYGADEGFRSRIVMGRHGFGRGEYRYFAYPLPPLVERLRTALYTRLVPVANRFFGGNIGVTGLLAGADVAAALATQPDGDRYLLPDVVLSRGVFLDGETVAVLPRAVEVVETDGAALVRAVSR